MLSVRTRLIILGIIIAVCVGSFMYASRRSIDRVNYQGEVRYGDHLWKVHVADEDYERERGLSGFISLPENEGMWFTFWEPAIHGFWMKDMNFSLDIIWLKKISYDTYEVVFIAENVAPDTYPQVIQPEITVDAVLELNAGQVERYGIPVGSTVNYKQFD